MRGGAQKRDAGGAEGRQLDRTDEAAFAKNLIDCSAQTITDVCDELMLNGVGLRSTGGATQLATLRRALEYRGTRGLNTYEGTAAGYCRLATRIGELRDSWDIHTVTEDVLGPDGLMHKGVARYILQGRRKDLPPAPQQQ